MISNRDYLEKCNYSSHVKIKPYQSRGGRVQVRRIRHVTFRADSIGKVGLHLLPSPFRVFLAGTGVVLILSILSSVTQLIVTISIEL